MSAAEPGTQKICSECKAPNDLSAVTCKKCGEILSTKKGSKKGQVEEFDATQGSFSNACFIVPAVLFGLALLIFFFSLRGAAKPGTCAYNRERIGLAIMAYSKQNPSDKMETLDMGKLLRSGKNGKPYLKEKPSCPKDSSAEYFIDSDGIISCRICKRK